MIVVIEIFCKPTCQPVIRTFVITQKTTVPPPPQTRPVRGTARDAQAGTGLLTTLVRFRAGRLLCTLKTHRLPASGSAAGSRSRTGRRARLNAFAGRRACHLERASCTDGRYDGCRARCRAGPARQDPKERRRKRRRLDRRCSFHSGRRSALTRRSAACRPSKREQ